MLLYARQRLGRVGSVEEAQDVVQEAFIRLMSQIATGREPGDVRAWLFTCVRNAAVDKSRSESPRRRRERRVAEARAAIDRGEGSTSGLFDSMPGGAIDAAAAEQALASLAPDLREVVTLRIWGAMTLSQIAGVTGWPVSTVHDRYRAALHKLKVTLEPSSLRGEEMCDATTCRQR